MNVQRHDISVYPEAAPRLGSGVWSPSIARVRAAWDALAARLLAPVDNSSIVAFRVFYGAIMMWEVYRYFRYGWIDMIYVNPQFHFKYLGFGWAQGLPGGWMHALFASLGVLAFLIMVGLWYRIAAPLFFLGFTYVFLLDKAHYLNHLYLACLMAFLLMFVPAHRAFSLDVLRQPKLRSFTAPTWALVLLASQLAIVYFYGGLAKLHMDWLQGDPMRIWMAGETDFRLLGRWFTEEWMVKLVSWGGVAFDLLVVPALLWRRTRWFAVVALVLFHRFNAEMFNIGIFPMFGTLSVVLLLPPDLPRRIVHRITGEREPKRKRSRKRGRETATEGSSWRDRVIPFSQYTTLQRVTVILVVAYLAVQLLVPFRHWLYPGTTQWTTQGDRFSWRMMLTSKRGSLSYEVFHPATGQRWDVDPRDYLTRSQYSRMIGQPDMILQFAHHLADEWRQNGFDDVEVRAISAVSLNGRDHFAIVDPQADLASEHMSIFNNPWITSIEEFEQATEAGSEVTSDEEE